jgi:4-hydroxy-tetrahydrodipicolinate synthase
MGLPAKERVRVVAACSEIANGRAPVIAGVLTPCLPDAIDEARSFLSAGADAIMLVEPYYNRLTQDGIIGYITSFLDGVGCPLLLYDIPYRTGVRMAPETIAALVEQNETIIGMKMSNPDMADYGRTMDAVADRLSVLTGEEHLFVDHMLGGAKGAIIATNNLVPQAWSSIYEALVHGRHEEARALHRALVPLIDAAFSSTNPGPLKAALPAVGIEAGPLLPGLPSPAKSTVEGLLALAAPYIAAPRPD